MPTTAERNALVFLATIAVVGAGVRVSASRRFVRDVNAAAGIVSTAPGSPAARALEAQIAAVDSARAVASSRPKRSGATRRRSSSDQRNRSTPMVGTNPTTDPGERPRSRRLAPRDRPPPVSPENPIDINTATTAELELLPRVGPALAKRMIAWRNANGPFSTEADLRHVPGIGVTTAALLVPLVTFSSGYRPFQSEARPSRYYPDLPAI